MKRVIVVGAGAAGMMAAIWAARKGAQVTLLEGMDRPGKKLLVTGNGRCNLTNMDMLLPDSYYGSGAEMASGLIRQFDAKALRAFFEEIGLLTQEKNGYVYPYSGQAVSVLEVLLTELRRCKVKLKLSEKIDKIYKDNEVWQVCTASWKYEADAVILACGSCAAPVTGSDGSGYGVAEALGHSVIAVKPALVPVLSKEKYLSSLAGVRCRACVSLYKNGQYIKSDTGELQWTKNGVSGIVVFQLSRFISCADEKDRLYLELDLLPEFSKEQLMNVLRTRAAMIPNEKLLPLLAGVLHEKLIPVVLEQAEKKIKGNRLNKLICQNLTDEVLEQIIHVIKQMRLTVNGTKSFDTAQVCAGGVDASEVNRETLESVLQKGIYFAGELLDVDGPCGGYNLQWAWSSGFIAGCSAALSE